MRYAVSINNPAWLWRPVVCLMKPVSTLPVVLTLAALSLAGTMLVFAGERRDFQPMFIAGLALTAPFFLWATAYLFLLLVGLVALSAKVLSGAKPAQDRCA